jgi:hypothetical protein
MVGFLILTGLVVVPVFVVLIYTYRLTQEIKQKIANKPYLCISCGYVGPRKEVSSFNGGIFFVLLLFLIIPAIIYALWANQKGEKSVCPLCGGDNIIPSDSPFAQKIMMNGKGGIVK